MKGVFLGSYELKKWGVKKVKSVLKKYSFTHIYLHEEVLNTAKDLKSKHWKVYAWVDVGQHPIQNIIEDINTHSKHISGVCLDVIRKLTHTWLNFFKAHEVTRKVKSIKEGVTRKDLDWVGCFKCEVYDSLLLNIINRLFYGQSLKEMYGLFSKCLMMSYHQEYKQPLEKVFTIIEKLKKFYGRKITPIFQTYQDFPKVNYNLHWKGYEKYKKSKAYFRLGTCKLESFL